MLTMFSQGPGTGSCLACSPGMNQTTIPPVEISPAGYTVEAMRDRAEWDAFVRTAVGATHAHLSGWQVVLQEQMRHRTRYLVARAPDGALRGVLPLMEFNSPLFGSRMISVPCLSDGGPLGEPGAVHALMEAAQALAADGSAAIELRCRTAPAGAAANSRKVTVLLDLPSDSGALWNALPSKLRSQIRRPQKAGMTTRFGLSQLPSFYDVWSRNMRDLGTPVLPRRFFEAAAATFPDTFMVGCVYRDDVPVAAGAGFLFRGEFEITWASSLREHNRDAPNMLLYWSFMERVIERGASVFNFGRCTPGEGTHRFKLQWGGESVPLHWISVPEEGLDGGPGRIARLGSAVWQRLPVSVANAIGPSVARQLPWW